MKFIFVIFLIIGIFLFASPKKKQKKSPCKNYLDCRESPDLASILPDLWPGFGKL